MILQRATITGFRSIRDRQVLFFDSAVTVLIGANDHGKSNLLAGIRCLNDDTPFTEDDRHWDLKGKDLPAIEWEFKLSDEERKKIADTRPVPPPPPQPSESDEEPKAPAPIPEVPECVTLIREAAGSKVALIDEDDVFTDEQVAVVLKMRPRVELFEPAAGIVDEIGLQQLEQPQFEPMKGIFLKAGLWGDRANLFTQNAWSSRQLAEASERLTEVLRREWEQGRDLEWKFEHAGNNGNIIRLLIKDPAVRNNYVRPSQRSQGFTSFFILSLTVFARTAAHSFGAAIFLFDEPGTYLHPIAQVNLQRVFESLAERSQIAYATHSIFLVNKNVPGRNRVIRKAEGGTVVDRKPFSGNWKAVRESLGITLAHNFLISDRTLLVEGPSDAVYVAATLLYLVRSRQVEIDLNDFSIADAGTSQNMVAMTRIMLKEGRKVVVLLDGDGHGQKVKKELEKTCSREIASADHELVIHLLPAGKSIEDLVPWRCELFAGTADAARALLDEGVRTLAPGKDANAFTTDLAAAESARGNDTLGTVLEKTTKTWFKGTDSVSKLQIALRYEDRLPGKAHDADHPVDGATTDLVSQLQQALKLQPRKAGKAMFEDDSANT